MFVSARTGKIHVCSGNYQWFSYTPNDVGVMVSMDAQLFIY
jgi:hypothetical protein